MKKESFYKRTIEDLAEGLPDFYPLPDITPLQKEINRLYMKLRMCGMPLKQVNIEINKILSKHKITREQILKI
jgi:hypothetical protein